MTEDGVVTLETLVALINKRFDRIEARLDAMAGASMTSVESKNIEDLPSPCHNSPDTAPSTNSQFHPGDEDAPPHPISLTAFAIHPYLCAKDFKQFRLCALDIARSSYQHVPHRKVVIKHKSWRASYHAVKFEEYHLALERRKTSDSAKLSKWLNRFVSASLKSIVLSECSIGTTLDLSAHPHLDHLHLDDCVIADLIPPQSVNRITLNMGGDASHIIQGFGPGKSKLHHLSLTRVGVHWYDEATSMTMDLSTLSHIPILNIDMGALNLIGCPDKGCDHLTLNYPRKSHLVGPQVKRLFDATSNPKLQSVTFNDPSPDEVIDLSAYTHTMQSVSLQYRHRHANEPPPSPRIHLPARVERVFLGIGSYSHAGLVFDYRERTIAWADEAWDNEDRYWDREDQSEAIYNSDLVLQWWDRMNDKKHVERWDQASGCQDLEVVATDLSHVVWPSFCDHIHISDMILSHPLDLSQIRPTQPESPDIELIQMRSVVAPHVRLPPNIARLELDRFACNRPNLLNPKRYTHRPPFPLAQNLSSLRSVVAYRMNLDDLHLGAFGRPIHDLTIVSCSLPRYPDQLPTALTHLHIEDVYHPILPLLQTPGLESLILKKCRYPLFHLQVNFDIDLSQCSTLSSARITQCDLPAFVPSEVDHFDLLWESNTVDGVSMMNGWEDDSSSSEGDEIDWEQIGSIKYDEADWTTWEPLSTPPAGWI